MQHRTHDWALVIATGEDRRSHASSTVLDGEPMPQPFCPRDGRPSLFQDAMGRAAAIARPGQTCVVVAGEHRRWWARPLEDLPPQNVMAQSVSRGTAVDMLVPLLRLARRDPLARVAVLPTDHRVQGGSDVVRSLRTALTDVAAFCDDVLLLGLPVDATDTNFAYLLPGGADGTGLAPVAACVEPPGFVAASQLIARGAVRDSGMVVARLESLLALYERRFPEVVTALSLALGRERLGDVHAVSGVLEKLPEIDFLRHVLPDQQRFLRLVIVPACRSNTRGARSRARAARNFTPLSGRLLPAS
jgi:mannose-1-phosphate guanylyltransferase